MDHEEEFIFNQLKKLMASYDLETIFEQYSDYEPIEILEHLVFVGILNIKDMSKTELDFSS
jgi:hypothetical protein